MPRKDKKQIQIKNKQRHLKNASGKKRNLGLREEPKLERKEPSIPLKKSFLIICEGKNTEPNYFNMFKLKTARIKALGHGFNTISLVKRTIQIVTEEKNKDINYDEVWCVFDKDDFDSNDFNGAIQLAQKNKVKVAYSNQCFEYWLLLHFNDHQGGTLQRERCYELLNNALKNYNLNYDCHGTKRIEEKLFNLMFLKEKPSDKESRVKKAISRGRKIYDLFDHINPASEESSTKVFLLVSEILKYI